jgi:hypothetical protein
MITVRGVQELNAEEVNSLIGNSSDVYIDGYFSIGEGAFKSTRLRSLRIGRSIVGIKDNAFEGLTTLKEVVFDEGSKLKTLGFRCFKDTGLEHIALPNEISTIFDQAFSECTSLRSIQLIGKSLSYIGYDVFMYSTLETFIATEQQLDALNLKKGKNFISGKENVSVTITSLEDAEELEEAEEAETEKVVSPSIPLNNVERVSLIVSNTSSTHTIDGTGELTSTIVQNNIGDGSTAENVIISGFSSIISRAFDNSALSGSITLPESLTSIADRAFYKCSNLNTVIFEGTSQLNSIGSRAFYQTGLTTLNLPNSIETIGDFVFYNSSSLTSVVFNIGSNLSSIVLDGNNSDNNTFGNTGLTSFTAPQSVLDLFGVVKGDGQTVGGKTNVFVSLYQPQSRAELDAALTEYFSGSTDNLWGEINSSHPYPILNDWDVSLITDFMRVFENKRNFNQDISGWNMSNAVTAREMFENCRVFNQDLTGWDVSKIENFSYMFRSCAAFNQDISTWDVSSGTNFSVMFRDCQAFDQPGIRIWKPTQNANFASMFYGNVHENVWAYFQAVTPDISLFHQTAFTANTKDDLVTALEEYFTDDTWSTPKDDQVDAKGIIGDWFVEKISDFSGLFQDKSGFNSNIVAWDMSNATNVSNMFKGTSFNQDISTWDVSNVETFNGMFDQTPFNQDISGWNVSNSTSFSNMFSGATAFNINIGGWNVSKSLAFDGMFSGATSFNQDIRDWDVSKSTTFAGMFSGATAFDQPIGSWNVSSCQEFQNMFTDVPSFNRDLSGWDMSEATNISNMFKNASSFYQLYIEIWDTSNVSNANYQSMFEGTPQGMIDYFGGNVTPTSSRFNKTAQTSDNLTVFTHIDDSTQNIHITSTLITANYVQSITKVNIKQITIGNSVTSIAENAFKDCTSLSSVTIRNSVTSIGVNAFNNTGLSTIGFTVPSTVMNIGYGDSSPGQGQSGDMNGDGNVDVADVIWLQKHVNGEDGYDFGTANLQQQNAFLSSDQLPGLVSVVTPLTPQTRADLDTALSQYFSGDNTWATPNTAQVTEKGDINTWDVSQITDFSRLFLNKSGFNSDIGNWDVSNATDFALMFYGTSFNKDIGGWNVSKVESFRYMFYSTPFNQDIGDWDVSNSINFEMMYYGNSHFNQDIRGWDVSKSTTFNGMFGGASAFDQPIGSWDVSSGQDFQNMFSSASSFNRDLSGWDMSEATNLRNMFKNASSFYQHYIEIWTTTNVTNYFSMLEGTPEGMWEHFQLSNYHAPTQSNFNKTPQPTENLTVFTHIDESIQNVHITNSLSSDKYINTIAKDKFKSVKIGSSVTSISSNAFQSCTHLTTVALGNGVATIDDTAFDSCTALTTVLLGTALTSINENAFQNTNIGNVSIPSSSQSGDMNGDGNVDVADVIWLQKYVNGEDGYDFGTANLHIQKALSYYELGSHTSSNTNNDDAIQDIILTNKVVNNSSSTHTISGTGMLTSSIVSSLIGDGSEASNVIIQGYTTIHTSAFEDSNLSGTVTIPNTVTSIGNRAFMNCSNITNFIFEENSQLETLGESVFINGQFVSITLPASVKTISRNVFQGCDQLTTLNLMEGSVLSTIGNFAFYGSKISSIDFPASLTTIGESAFESCGSLNTVTFVSGSGSMLSTIGERAFRACTNLESIILPSSMSTIGERAFYECASMTSLSFNSDSVNSNEPLPIMTIGKESFGHSELTGSITLPATLRSIGMNAFLSCVYLTSVSFESGSHLWDIGYNAFQACGLIGNFVIPSSVRIVRTYAFQGCTSLNSVTFESNSQLRGTGTSIFQSCTAFHTVTAPQSVLDILGIYAGATNNSIGNIDGITAILEGDSITFEYNYTFDGVGELTTEIVDDAFDGSFSGVSSDIRVLVTGYNKLGNRSFYYKGDVISHITLGTSVEIIAERAFEAVDPLKSVNFQGTSTLTKIERYAFFLSNNLTSITLPSSLTELAEWAFYNCGGLRTVTFENPSSLATLGEKTFFVTSLVTFTAPLNVLNLYGVTEGPGKSVGGMENVQVIDNTEEVPEIGGGDLNGDGIVDVSDLVYMQKHLNRIEGYELEGTDFSPP